MSATLVTALLQNEVLPGQALPPAQDLDLHTALWLQLTGDLQVLRQVRRSGEIIVVPAARLRLVF
ncbi:MAG TPA: hypothetical protein VK864_04435 [Longimicrobiales bacterium]|nr:hypothetical protein [Longimicrobiales bacterium]